MSSRGAQWLGTFFLFAACAGIVTNRDTTLTAALLLGGFILAATSAIIAAIDRKRG